MDGDLETPRLLLRRFTPDDVDNVWELDRDPEVMRHVSGGQPTAYSVVRDRAIPRFLTYHRDHPGIGYWAVEEKETRAFIGRIFLTRVRTDPDALEIRSEEHTSELQSLRHLVCRLLLEKKK